MATIATLITPVEIDTLELLDPYGYGDLLSPFEQEEPNGVTAILASRFPTPPAAFGFLIGVQDSAITEVEGVTVYTGALYPESPYLEPTIGQIWPRIG